MKPLKKILYAALALCLCTSGCTKNTDNEKAVLNSKVWNIGIMESGENPYNSIIADGFATALSDELPDDTASLTIECISIEKSGSQITDSFIKNDDDLILTIGRPALRSAAAITYDIPIITTDVIDIGQTIGIESPGKDMRTRRNVTGVTGLPDIADQLSLVLEVCPDIKTLGLLYKKGDIDSLQQIKIMQEYLRDAGVDQLLYQISDVKSDRIKRICKRCDAIFIPSGSYLYEDAAKISKVAAKLNTPTIGGDVIIGENTLVSLCPDYYSIGYTAGLQAAEILKKNKNPGRIAIEPNSSDGIKLYNASIAKKMDITFPKSFHEYDPKDLNSVFSDR